ncbi:exodeoxyribonuclease V subunit alpha [Pseudonocardia kunmingensis]|uniref:RecBCD enzyme subunit RecD n=1 Tax=Pseudonocardia kunmingensis TaxID=630975 RepID=A0A543DN00_9PSEU|nr:exodeoxyribonuclease V subunit alpha [Pseudonocardia kunmingensis]TQM10711.1 DNA helicase/exodeoxyribonuclease V alpha subunit [Pseudonocardia kunmingensis]
MTVDLGDVRLARSAGGLLGAFNAAGVLEPADVHVATRVGRLGGETDEEVLLAAALAVRAVRLGSVCVDLTAVSHTVLGEGDELVDVSALPWPDPPRWLAACAASGLVARGPDAAGGRPLRLVDELLYLERYWGEEELVRRSLTERAAVAPPQVDLPRLRDGLQRYFSAPGSERQRLAAAVSVLRRVTVLAGGPGTGKTTTVARLLALLHEQPGPPPRVALAAPTGKAAARLQEAVAAELPAELRSRTPDAATLHRLLGWRPGGRFRYGRAQRLPFDVVVVDETSMVSLTMMARLLDAVRPQARLVLVGDPDQLASVEAGAVLGDLARASGRPEPELDTALSAAGVVGGLVGGSVINGVVTLQHVWRFGGAIAEFARAVQAGDADAAVALLRAGHDDLGFVDTAGTGGADPGAGGVRADVVAAGRELTGAAMRGDAPAALAALERHRVLCAHRRGPFGVTRWSAEIERWLRAALPEAPSGPWYPGRPVLVTANDYDIGLFNGDTGVVVALPEGLRVAFARDGVPTLHPPARLSEVATVHAMTVHRGQGSQFRRVTVVLPPAESPLLTRELLYTAVTRAAEFVRVVGTEEAVRTAVQRPISRASGLRHRLGR